MAKTLLCFVAILLVASQSGFAQTPAEKAKQLVERCQARWKEIRQQQASLFDVIESKSTIEGRTKHYRTSRKNRVDSFCAEVEERDSEGKLLHTTVTAHNPEYYFNLRKEANLKNWVVLDCNKRDADPSRFAEIQQLNRPRYQYMSYVLDVPLENYLVSPQIEITDFKEESERIIISFKKSKAAAPESQFEGFSFDGGQIVLSSNFDCCICEEDFWKDRGENRFFIRRYEFELDRVGEQSIPYTKRHTYVLSLRHQPKTPSIDQVLNSTPKALTSPPSYRDFSLSAFSLPELQATSLIERRERSPDAEEPRLVVSGLDIPRSKLEEQHTLTVKLRNPTKSALRIVGCQSAVGGIGGWFVSMDPNEFEIGPGESKEAKVVYHGPPVSGFFEQEFVIYLASDELIRYPLKIEGEAVK